MPPFAPNNAPSLPSERFNSVSNRQYRLSTFVPVTGSVSTSLPQTTPTCGFWNHRTSRRTAEGSIIVFASESTAIEPVQLRYDRVENGGLAGSLHKRDELDTPAAIFVDDVHGAIAARIGCDDELELVLWIIQSEEVVDTFTNDRLFVMSHDQDRHAREVSIVQFPWSGGRTPQCPQSHQQHGVHDIGVHDKRGAAPEHDKRRSCRAAAYPIRPLPRSPRRHAGARLAQGCRRPWRTQAHRQAPRHLRQRASDRQA